jgi:hypothetical protein
MREERALTVASLMFLKEKMDCQGKSMHKPEKAIRNYGRRSGDLMNSIH